MITPSADPFIHNSAINRHLRIARRRKMIPKQIPSKPIKRIVVKEPPKKIITESVIKEEPVQLKTIEEIEPEYIENVQESTPIEEQIKQEHVNISSMEEAVQTAINDTPTERNVDIEQRNTYNVFGNRTTNASHHYTYNSILGTRVYYN